ncbi:hypothetical protein [Corynebacterium bovis]|uniref:hypothetical protein n=2 Tax=Corynebacterium bovis TaxID=36808 RepID=UPI000F654BC2|nr:hypothetical protein [Corynebacterium bovis]RRO79506.1 hypothetical protein CXF38_09175 [Corynebacterium bovis]
MEITVRALTHDNGAEIQHAAARSVFWELPCDHGGTPCRSDDPEFDKELWLQSVLFQWGICGYTAYVGTGDAGTGQRPAATVTFAPARYLPGHLALPTAPASPDAVLIANVWVDEPYMGLYLEHTLIDTVMTEAARRGIKAVEAFGRNDDDIVAGNEPDAGSLFPGGSDGDGSADGGQRSAGPEGQDPSRGRAGGAGGASGHGANGDGGVANGGGRGADGDEDGMSGAGAEGTWSGRLPGEGTSDRGEAATRPGHARSSGDGPESGPRRGPEGGPEGGQPSRPHGGSQSGPESSPDSGSEGGPEGADDGPPRGRYPGIKRWRDPLLDGASYVPEGYRGWELPDLRGHADADRDPLLRAPILSVDILKQEGFSVVAAHPRYPRYRIELDAGYSMFARFAEDDHTAVNEVKPLRTVLGGGIPV